jgi:AraC-like DNA-binding protein
MGPLGMLAVNAPSLGAALRHLCRYFPAMQEHSDLSLVADGDLMRLEYQIRDGRIAARRQDAELSIGIFNNFFRRCFGAAWSPEEVHFEHLRAAAAADYRALLNAPVYFAQSTNAIVFRRAALDAPMPAADPRLLPALLAELRGRANAARPDDFIGLVVRQIRAGFSDGDPSIERAAVGLGMSRAKLYRQLSGYGIEFSDLTQALRQELAMMYVVQSEIPLTEIAPLLGYSELSAFSRAFRRWTGVSPAAYRATRLFSH